MEERIKGDRTTVDMTVTKADLIDLLQRSLTGISEIIRVLGYYNKAVPQDLIERKERYMKLFDQLTGLGDYHLEKEPEDVSTTD